MTEGISQTTQPAQTAAAPIEQAPTAPTQDAGKTFTQEDVNRLLASERRSQEQRFADAATKAAEYDKLTEQSKSDLQKATERAEKAEREAATATAARLRFEVAAEKGLTAKQAARLVGSTREELLADADALRAEFAPATTSANPAAVGLRIDQPQGAVAPNDIEGAARAFFGL